MFQQHILQRLEAKQPVTVSMGIVASTALLVGMPVLTEAQSLNAPRHEYMSTSPTCSRWATMTEAAQFGWTNHFLVSMSYGIEAYRRKGQQQYKPNAGIEQVVAAINTQCAAKPDDTQVSEIAAPFLNP